MDIKRYVSELLCSNMYVVTENGHALIIDPYDDITIGYGLKVDKILLTHEHYDHISGVNEWKKVYGAPVLCSTECAKNIQNPRKNLANLFTVFCELQTWIELEKNPKVDAGYVCEADEVFSNEMSFKWQEHKVKLFEMPGHSAGSIGIIIDEKIFFSGDSLMENFDIELRLPGGSKKKWESIGKPRLQKISDGMMVYPGHFQEFEYKGKGGN